MTAALELVLPLRGRAPLVLVFAAAVAIGIGLYASPERTWLNVLLNGFYLTSLAVSSNFFLATQFASGAEWSAGLRRILEAFMFVLPLGGALLLAVFFGRAYVYPWAAAVSLPSAPELAFRAKYLDPRFVLIRMVLALAIWAVFARTFRKTSLEQDDDPTRGVSCHRRLGRQSAAFLVAFALTFTIASFDWILSIEPRWFSTMFAVYVFAGTFVQGIAAVTLVVVVLRERDHLRSYVKISHLHDLGKLLFAFSTFWAYIWLCQYLLIWYGNLPEEATYYVRRTSGAWGWVFALNFVVNWAVPFVVLMSARAKRDPLVLRRVAAILLVGHWLDLYLLVMPSKWEAPRFGLVEAAVPLVCGFFSYLLVTRALSRAPLIPLNDPILVASRGEIDSVPFEVPGT